MTQRIRLNLVTGVDTDKDIVLTGQTENGPVEIEIPGSAAGAIMVALTGATNLRKVSHLNLEDYLQTQGYNVRSSSHPEQVQLELLFYPSGSARFEMPRTILRDLGQDLVKQATGPQTKIERKPS